MNNKDLFDSLTDNTRKMTRVARGQFCMTGRRFQKSNEADGGGGGIEEGKRQRRRARRRATTNNNKSNKHSSSNNKEHSKNGVCNELDLINKTILTAR